MDTKQEMIDAVKAHALCHYEDGWDFVVECYDEKDITDVIGKARTCAGAIKKMKSEVVFVNRHAKEIRTTTF